MYMVNFGNWVKEYWACTTIGTILKSSSKQLFKQKRCTHYILLKRACCICSSRTNFQIEKKEFLQTKKCSLSKDCLSVDLFPSDIAEMSYRALWPQGGKFLSRFVLQDWCKILQQKQQIKTLLCRVAVFCRWFLVLFRISCSLFQFFLCATALYVLPHLVDL